MSETAAAPYILPSALITRADLARLVREVEGVDNDLEAQRARAHTTGKSSYHMPVTSRALTDFVDQNKLDLANDQARMLLKEQLKAMKDKAPIVHMTFAAEAGPEFLQQLITWMRTEIHPQTLLSVGLQPALVGGVYMRTPNHVHDFSLRAKFAKSRVIIQQDIDQMMHAIPVVEAPPLEAEPGIAQESGAVEGSVVVEQPAVAQAPEAVR